MRWLQAILLAVLLTIPTLLAAQSRKPATVAKIAAYMGADREQLLHAGAKTEGVATWYTSLAGDSYKPWRAPSKRNIPACASKFFAPAAAS